MTEIIVDKSLGNETPTFIVSPTHAANETPTIFIYFYVRGILHPIAGVIATDNTKLTAES